MRIAQRFSTLDPSRVDHFPQHSCSRREPIGRELAGRFGPSAVESARLLQPVYLFTSGSTLSKIRNVSRKQIAVDLMHSCHLRLDLSALDIGADKGSLKLPVNCMRGSVAIGVGTYPAVVLNRRMQRLRPVADIVPKPTGVEEDGLLDRGSILACG